MACRAILRHQRLSAAGQRNASDLLRTAATGRQSPASRPAVHTRCVRVCERESFRVFSVTFQRIRKSFLEKKLSKNSLVQ